MLAQTAELGVLLKMENMLSGPAASAEASLSKLNATTISSKGAASTAEKALGLVGSAATGMGNALNHAKGFLSNLISGPLGMIGLGAGAFGIAAFFQGAISKTTDLGLSIEKLTGLTGEDAAAMSGLIAVTGKYGISTDQLSTIVGFETKTLGKLAETSAAAVKGTVPLAKAQDDVRLASEKLRVAQEKLIETENKKKVSASQLTAAHNAVTDATAKLVVAQAELTTSTGATLPSTNKLVALQKLYGVVLTDSKGAALDFSTVLNNVSDYYNSNATAGQKAALASTIFGRGYAVLIPVLKLGAKGFADAQQAAVDLGLTLTDQNAVDLKNYRESLRNVGDAVGGLQLQLGLDLIPTLGDLANSTTKFVRENGPQIRQFFKDFIAGARGVGAFIANDVIPAIQKFGTAAQGAWNQIPPQLRTLLIEALVGNKVIKTVFGIDIVGSVAGAVGDIGKSLLSSLVGSIFGKSIATPLVNVDGAVVNVGGLGPASAVGPLETVAAGGAGIVGSIVGGVGSVLAGFVLPELVLNAIKGLFPGVGKGSGGGNALPIGGGNGGSPEAGMIAAVNKNSASIAANAGMIAAVNKNSASIANTNAARNNASLLAMRAASMGSTAMLQAAMKNLTGMTSKELNIVAHNIQLQTVAANSNHRLSYAQLTALSHTEHADHLTHMAKLDHLTVKEEAVKLAIQAQKLAVNVAVANKILINGRNIYTGMTQTARAISGTRSLAV